MKIVLAKTIESVGKRGEVKDVADGYARNYLLPKNLAIIANDATLKKAETWRKEEQKRDMREKEQFQEIATNLKDIVLTFTEKTKNDKGELYGSVDTGRIADELKKLYSIVVERKWMHLTEPLKSAGKHAVNVTFPHGVNGEIQITIQPES